MIPGEKPGLGTGVELHANNYRPLAYDLPNQQGGIYWINGPSTAKVALDFNMGNYMTSFLQWDNICDTENKANPDALPIKPVLK